MSDWLGKNGSNMNAGFSTRTVIVEYNCLLYNIPKEILLDICKRFRSFYDFFLVTFGQNDRCVPVRFQLDLDESISGAWIRLPSIAI